METRDRAIDDLLEDYLSKGEVRRDRREQGGEQAARRPREREPDRASPPALRQEAKPRDAELEDLLSSYLEVSGGRDQDFAVPRSPEVDELLRRYVLEEQDVSQDLANSLREHVRTTRETAEERAVTVTPGRSSSDWSQAVATQLRETQDIDERM